MTTTLSEQISNSSWPQILDQTRAYSQNFMPVYDLRRFYRGRVYAAGGSRAEAFADMLGNLPIYQYKDELIMGSRAGFFADQLPEGITEQDYSAAMTAQDEKGERDFVAGWDHTLADYPRLFKQGIGGYIDRIDQAAEGATEAEQEVLNNMRITMQAFSAFIKRHADEADDPELKESLEHISLQPARTFREAMQLVWLTQITFVAQGRNHMALGRIDQYLYPLYKADIEKDILDDRQALDLLCHMWARIEELGEVNNICIGGLTPAGDDAVNELTYLCIEATRLVQSPHTNLSARFHDNAPEEYYRASFECIKTGVGFPAIFNDHVLLEGLIEIGIPEEIANDYCPVGCIETMLPGRQPAWSDGRFNTPQYLLNALHRFNQESDRSWDTLLALFKEEIMLGLTEYTDRVNNYIEKFPVAQFEDPFLSALIRDCIERKKDINAGGAEFFRMHGICIMGLATVSDSLAAVKKLVIEEEQVELSHLLNALEKDFEGEETLRQTLLNHAPKYGNDDDYVDSIAQWVVTTTSDMCLEFRLPCGGRYVSAMAANVSNIGAGKETGATPDGRKAGVPLSDAASPFYGRDKNGPTAFLQSVGKPDYHRVLTGSVINMKFEPEYFEDEEGAQMFIAMMKFFVIQRIQELQFNFSGNKLLKEAQEHPELHENLVVRVSGFSEYFTRLAREVQDDIIRRRAHGA